MGWLLKVATARGHVGRDLWSSGSLKGASTNEGFRSSSHALLYPPLPWLSFSVLTILDSVTLSHTYHHRTSTTVDSALSSSVIDFSKCSAKIVEDGRSNEELWVKGWFFKRSCRGRVFTVTGFSLSPSSEGGAWLQVRGRFEILGALLASGQAGSEAVASEVVIWS